MCMDFMDDTYCMDRRTPTKYDELLLLEEVDSICPVCGISLIHKQAKKKKQFEIAHIYPNSPTKEEVKELMGVERLGSNSEDIQNWIALCSKCHTEYDFHKTKDEYLKMLGCKKKLLSESDTKRQLSEKNIESELANIIVNLCNLSQSDLENISPLSYDALCVSEKISNPLLCREISSKVVDYYLFIKEQFEIQELSNKRSSLELIAANIKHAYYVCKTEGLDENQIFSNLCNWLISKIHCDNTSAQIIIAFFVQNCDAYEKLS